MSLLWIKTASQSDEEIGRALHPNVDHYQSGGIGHRAGDESRSVVGFVPTHQVAKYREHDGTWNGQGTDYDERKCHEIAHDIKSGKGITNPLQMLYDPKSKMMSLGEGNHRLRGAEIAGASHVPVRVNRVRGITDDDEWKQAPPQKTHWKGNLGEDYFPSDAHPDHFDWGHDD